MAISQVVAAKADGNLYNITPPNIRGSGAGGNGGSVAKASNSSLLDGVAVSRYDGGVFGSTVLDNNDADKALTVGTFAYNNNRPVSKRSTTTINGLNNSVLLSGAAEPTLVHSIHKIQVATMGYSDGVRTRKLTSAIRANKWNEYIGEFESGYPEVSVDLFNTDIAANPTRSVPGYLTYKSQSSTTLSLYKEKTG